MIAYRTLVLAALSAWLGSFAAPAIADDVLKGVLGALLQGAAVGEAKKSWEGVDSNVKTCLRTRFGLDVAKLAEQGIAANDNRLASQRAACQQQVNQALARAKQEEQARTAALERARQEEQAKQEAAERGRQEAERARKEEQARIASAAAARKAAADARRRELAAKYGPSVADAIIAGQVNTGMTKEQVVASRGSPGSKDVIPPTDELWHYGAQQIAFTNGKVTYVSH